MQPVRRFVRPTPDRGASGARSGAPPAQRRAKSPAAPAARPAPGRTQQQRLLHERSSKGRAQSSRRKRRWLAGLLLLLLAIFWVRPPTSPAANAPEAAAKRPAHRAAPPAAHRAEPRPSPLPPPKTLAVALPPKKPLPVVVPDGISRELLLAAVQARSPTLRACPLPPGAPARVSARLRVARAGELRTVQFVNAEPLPRPLAECLRTTLQGWTFKDLPLKSDVEVLVDFLLGA